MIWHFDLNFVYIIPLIFWKDLSYEFQFICTKILAISECYSKLKVKCPPRYYSELNTNFFLLMSTILLKSWNYLQSKMYIQYINMFTQSLSTVRTDIWAGPVKSSMVAQLPTKSACKTEIIYEWNLQRQSETRTPRNNRML